MWRQSVAKQKKAALSAGLAGYCTKGNGTAHLLHHREALSGLNGKKSKDPSACPIGSVLYVLTSTLVRQTLHHWTLSPGLWARSISECQTWWAWVLL